MAAKLLMLALFGGLGTLARYGMTEWARRVVGVGFPWGTLLVNGIGSFLFAFIWVILDGKLGMHSEWKPYLLIGFLGAFTTFSTYSFETVQLGTAGNWTGAALNLLAQNGVGIGAAVLGIVSARLIA